MVAHLSLSEEKPQMSSVGMLRMAICGEEGKRVRDVK